MTNLFVGFIVGALAACLYWSDYVKSGDAFNLGKQWYYCEKTEVKSVK